MKKKFLSVLLMLVILMLSVTTIAFADGGTLIYDNGGIRITYLNGAVNEYGDFDINVYIENYTDQYICVQTRKESVNGYMLEGIMSESIAPGNVASTAVIFDVDWLKDNYISAIYDIEFAFHIFNEADIEWSVIDDSDIYSFSFGGIALNNGVTADERLKTPVYNDGSIVISYINTVVDEFDDVNVNFLIENNSAQNIIVMSDNSTINGTPIESYMAEEVLAGKKMYGDMSFWPEDLMAGGITSIGNVVFELDINDENYNTIVKSQPIMLSHNSLPVSFNSEYKDEISVIVNGNFVYFDVPPTIIDGRTLVPLRAIFEALGADVGWDPATQTATAINDSTQVSIQIGSNQLYVNGSAKTLDVPAIIIDGRTLVPARAVSEAFGYGVKWIPETRTVVIE